MYSEFRKLHTIASSRSCFTYEQSKLTTNAIVFVLGGLASDEMLRFPKDIYLNSLSVEYKITN